jgi:6-hydroxycyclohex-1-ene-1-carbonyl-CoA dehydrogenase
VKAAVFYGPDRPLSVEDVPMPEPGAGQVLIEVAGCGVCHTDLHYLDHGTPTFKTPPMILGHEISGTVTGVGDGVKNLKEGDRVLVAAVTSCGTCEACREGRENVCANGEMLGNHIDGGFAEFVVAPAKDTFVLPDEVPLVEGSIIADAITTPYHAVVNRGRVRPGDAVVVFGCGGVGLNVVQVAAAQGARVVAVDLSDDKLAWAAKLGATSTVNPGAVERLDKVLRKLTGGGADVAFEAVGKAVTQEQALSSLKTGGRAVFVGYSPDTMTLNSGRVMFRELEVLGSLGCRPVDYPRVIEMVRQKRIRLTELVTHRFPLDQMNEALDMLRSGNAIRVVVTP